MAERQSGQTWIGSLGDEDLAFLKRFVVASGSLKALAEAYAVSYPTIRLRLDRLIEKIKILDSQPAASEFERQLRLLFAEGRIDMETMRRLLDAYRQEMEGKS